jgi:hypothetical protein
VSKGMIEPELYKISDRDVQHLFRFGDQIAISTYVTGMAIKVTGERSVLSTKIRRFEHKLEPEWAVWPLPKLP